MAMICVNQHLDGDIYKSDRRLHLGEFVDHIREKLKASAILFRKSSGSLHATIARGAEPKQLAFSAVLGITMGVFPICGVTVLICGVTIASLGSICHAPTVMLANFISTPI